MTAILETIIAVSLYWWIALKGGVVWPLLLSATVAPMVLLRSEPSIKLGLNWFLKTENYFGRIARELHGASELIFILLLILFVIPFAAIAIRISATLLHLKDGIRDLPGNFRRLVLCTSPAQIPETVPGIETTNSVLRFSTIRRRITPPSDEHWIIIITVPILATFLYSLLYAPAWLYRITIKSTAWFWWPLAFLGGDLKRAQNPALFRSKVIGSLWAKANIGLAILALLGFAAAHFGTLVFGQNELLTPIGKLLLIDWSALWSWQICALAASVLSLAIVFLLDDVIRDYKIAEHDGDAKSVKAAQTKFGWIERLSRLRLLFVLAFWGLVGTHAVLYANSQQCWFSLSPKLQEWAQDIYGDRLPRSNECP